MGQFNCIAALDQVMGYCATSVRKKDQPCLGIVTPWEIHVCNKLPQGVKTEADFYQREMTNLNEGLDYVKVLLDDTGILRKGDFVQHIEEFDEVLTQMEEAGLQISMAKIKWTVKEANFLGCAVNTQTQRKCKGCCK